MAQGETPHGGRFLTSTESLGEQASATRFLQSMPDGEGCALAKEMDKPLDTPCVILIPGNVNALRENTPLVGPVIIGRLLGAGLQARVHELILEDGTPTGKVVKIAHTDLGHKTLNAIWVKLEREWELGLKLRSALQDEETGALPGFLRVCDGLVTHAPSPPTPAAVKLGPRRDVRFAGMVLEKLNGWEVYKRIDAPEFHNIHYVREMLRQVFTSLDRAARETGFVHCDLGQRNVMEHYGEMYSELEEEDQRLNAESVHGGCVQQQQQQLEISTSGAEPRNNPVVGVFESTSGGSGAGGRVRPRPGFTCNSDGARMPLGPRVEFKIIDYGSSFFSDTLAQATGGFRARHNYDRLVKLFETKQALYKSPSGHAQIELKTAGKAEKVHILPTALRNRFTLKSTATTAGTAAPVEGATNKEEEGFNAAQRYQSVSSTTPHPQFDLPTASEMDSSPASSASPASPASPATSTATTTTASQKRDQPLTAATPPTNVIERMYRHFWRRKGDTFHLLLSLAIALDDRVWPREDQEAVQLFISLVHHVTGVKLSASFAAEGEPAAAGLWGRLGRKSYLRKKVEKYGMKGRWYGKFRRAHIRLKAHMYPYNSGLTAGEALVAPFFQAAQEPAPAPQPPATLEMVFPRSSILQ